MKTISLPGLAIIFGTLVSTITANADGMEPMDTELQEIEKVRNAYESEIMGIEGVVMVSTGLDTDGTPCLKIGTSVPPESIRDQLPNAIFHVNIEIDFVGEIKAQ